MFDTVPRKKVRIFCLLTTPVHTIFRVSSFNYSNYRSPVFFLQNVGALLLKLCFSNSEHHLIKRSAGNYKCLCLRVGAFTPFW